MTENDRTKGFRQTVTIDGHEVTIITDEDMNGKLVSFRLTCDVKNQLASDVLRCFAESISIGISNGVSLEAYVDEFIFTRFNPSGPVIGSDIIKQATSVIDYAMREIGVSYLGRHDLASSEMLPQKPRQDYSNLSSTTEMPYGLRSRDMALSSAILSETVKNLIEELQSQKPNREDELAAWRDTLNDLAALLVILNRLSERLSKTESLSETDIAAEKMDLAKAFTSFANRNHATIDTSVKMSLAAGFVGLFQAMGAEMHITTPVILAVFGGKKIIDIVKNISDKKDK